MEEENEYLECRTFYLTIIEARNLPNVHTRRTTRAYATISIGSPVPEENVYDRTETDNKNQLNPVWNHCKGYQISESAVRYDEFKVVIKLHCNCPYAPDRDIGEIRISMRQLYNLAIPLGGQATLDQPIIQGRDETAGILRFSYRFTDMYSVRKRELRDSIFNRAGAWIMRKVTPQVAAQVAAQTILFFILPVPVPVPF